MSYRRTARPPQSTASPAAETLMREAMESVNIPRVSRAPVGKPQVTLTLRDDGGLAIEIIEATGPRQLPLHDDASKAIAAIHRILAGQRAMLTAIGLDGAPTQAQVRDWSKQPILRDGPEVSRFMAGGVKRTFGPRAKLATGTTQTAEELGL